jgi:alkanesulfonate monooxygenase SsuD/methylene tetrahydromethanopterin reductase-like flavin-dependent oxidoreductase (luciferase family)
MERMGEGGNMKEFLRSKRKEWWLVGTIEDTVSQLKELEEAGVERVILQHLAHEDLEMVALLGEVAAVV